MKIRLSLVFLYMISVLANPVHSQNEFSKWYFGLYAALDFMSDPPTPLNNSAMKAFGCASISDKNGQLLFYTNCMEVYNSSHAVMANGTGILGGYPNGEECLIVKQPGSSPNYYIFTVNANPMYGARYSIVDIALAAGLGSVTIKNNTLITNAIEAVTAIRHSNNSDIWVILHPYGNDEFHSFLLSASGLGNAVVSKIGPTVTTTSQTDMKSSPTGRKLAWGYDNPDFMMLFDFDRSNGLVSNPIVLGKNVAVSGCEFSADGSKLYGCYTGGSGYLLQWDLCSGDSAVMSGSQFTLSQPGVSDIQMASNGKIYGINTTGDSLPVIQFPNEQGSGAGYNKALQPIGAGTPLGKLPNYATFYHTRTPGAFSYLKDSISCGAATFTAPCVAGHPPYVGVKWLFGDHASPANSSSLAITTHTFSSPGTYTVKLALETGNGADTLMQVIDYPFSIPNVSVSGNTQACQGDKVELTASGASSYTWNGNPSGATLTFTAVSSSIYTVTGKETNGCMSSKQVSVTISECISLPEEYEERNPLIVPNPARSEIHIVTDGAATIQLFDIVGQTIHDKWRIDAGKSTLNISHLSPGIYIIMAEYNGVKRLRKLIISR